MTQQNAASHGHDTMSRVVGAFDSRLVRAYCLVRFRILHLRFLDEIGQYLPDAGHVVDVGCGFGLFSLYYALRHPGLHLHGLDLNARRIDMARRAAAALALPNAVYDVADARTAPFDEGIEAAYMLDIIHHVPRDTVRPLLARIHAALAPGGRLTVKDIDTRPRWKLLFTYMLDRVMDPRTPVVYWSSDALCALLRDIGFEVYRHTMVDILPYPHLMYVCRKPD